MGKHLFKLKKDGKAVGYLEFKDGKFVYSNEDGSYVSPYCISIWKGKVFSFQCPAYSSSYYEHDECEYDSIHLFVTKDKNGKDVFADDEVQSKDGLRKYKVVWDGQRCRWWLCGVDKAWAVNEPIWEDYKLIKGKEDDTNKT